MWAEFSRPGSKVIALWSILASRAAADHSSHGSPPPETLWDVLKAGRASQEMATTTDLSWVRKHLTRQAEEGRDADLHRIAWIGRPI